MCSPSIAQLEERGTVICNLASVLSRGRWFEPGSKDIFLIAPLIKQVVFVSGFRNNNQAKTDFCYCINCKETTPVALKAQSSYFCRQDYVALSAQS
jgi:hypothetical protein